MDDHTERVRLRAYHIWLQEGRPEGREAAHWDLAREFVAIEDNQRQAMKKVARDPARKDVAAGTAKPTALKPSSPSSSTASVRSAAPAAKPTGRSATPAAMKTDTTKSTKGEPKKGASKANPLKPGSAPRGKK